MMQVSGWVNGGQVETIELCQKFATEAEAAEFAGRFPKSAKVKGMFCSSAEGGYGLILVHIGVKADGVNGGKNETGIKRIRTILKHIGNHGWEIKTDLYSNSATKEEILAAIGM